MTVSSALAIAAAAAPLAGQTDVVGEWGNDIFNPGDLDLLRVIDDPQKVVDAIFEHYEDRKSTRLNSSHRT